MGSFEFFKQYILKTFVICLGGFVLLGLAGYLVCRMNIDTAEQLFGELSKTFDEKGIIGEDGDVALFKLFLNNLRSTGISLVLGAVPFLFLPAFVILVNGGVIGVVFAVISAYYPGQELAYFAAGMLPHGIFEIPAICLGAALGINLCLFLCEKIMNKGKLANCDAIDYVGNLCRIFILVCIPLLIAAALIESFVTPLLLNLVI